MKILFQYVVTIINAIPFHWGTKLLMCIHLFRRDWRMAPLHQDPFLKSFQSLSLAEVKNTFQNLDALSQFYTENYFFFAMTRIPSERVSRFFYDLSLYDSGYSNRQKKRMKRECMEWVQRYQFPPPFPNAESIIFHHGLKNMPLNAFHYLENKDFIDAGACHGDSSLVFLDYHPHCIYAFEPSPRNGEIYQSVMETNAVPKTAFSLVNKGLSSQSGEISFSDTGDGNNALASEGETLVELTTLDSFVNTHSLSTIGLIKADLEGMGLEMLLGARQTICRDRPVLTLAIYHSPSEFVGIYQELMRWDLHYHFEIRPLAIEFNVYELTLLGYPEELLS